MARQSERIDPKTILTDGAQIIQRVLGPQGFQFQFQEEGKSSGGLFASGRFVRDDARSNCISGILSDWSGTASPVTARLTIPTCASSA